MNPTMIRWRIGKLARFVLVELLPKPRRMGWLTKWLGSVYVWGIRDA